MKSLFFQGIYLRHPTCQHTIVMVIPQFAKLPTKTDRYQPSDFSSLGREHCMHEKHLMQLDGRGTNLRPTHKLVGKMQKRIASRLKQKLLKNPTNKY